jgi:hypothetical protein
MAEQKSGAFVRWQEIRNKQLTDVNRLVIGLATGLLSVLNLKADQLKSPLQRWTGIASAALAAVSLVVGIETAWNRYKSFRATARVVRRREQKPIAKDRSPEQRQEIGQLRGEYKRWDCWSPYLLGFQLFTFLLAGVAFAVTEALIILQK